MQIICMGMKGWVYETYQCVNGTSQSQMFCVYHTTATCPPKWSIWVQNGWFHCATTGKVYVVSGMVCERWCDGRALEVPQLSSHRNASAYTNASPFQLNRYGAIWGVQYLKLKIRYYWNVMGLWCLVEMHHWRLLLPISHQAKVNYTHTHNGRMIGSLLSKF